MSIGYSRETISRLDSRGRKALALLGALVLSAFIFAFASEEAQAQQHHTATDEQVVGTAIDILPEASPAEEMFPVIPAPPITGPVSDLSTKQPTRLAPEPTITGVEPLVDPDLPIGSTLSNSETASGHVLETGLIYESSPVTVEHHDPELPSSEPELVEDEPGARLEPAPELDPVPPAGLEPASGPLGPETSTLALDPAPGPVSIEEGEPLSLLAEEAPSAKLPVPNLGDEGSYLLPVLGDSVINVEESLESAANALEALMEGTLSWAAESEGSIDTATLADLLPGGEAERAPASGPVQEPEPSSTGSESPLRNTPSQPVSPFTPPAASSFSLSGSQAGSGGVLLLLCVLASGPILMRRDFRLSWANCKLPKPTSALRLPLERPG